MTPVTRWGRLSGLDSLTPTDALPTFSFLPYVSVVQCASLVTVLIGLVLPR